MVNAFDSLNRTKFHAVDIQFETFMLQVVRIASGRITGFNKLPPTGFTKLILLSSLLAVSTGIS